MENLEYMYHRADIQFWAHCDLKCSDGLLTKVKNKEKAITLNWINSAVKLGSLRIQLQNIQAWSYILNKMLVLLILHYR